MFVPEAVATILEAAVLLDSGHATAFTAQECSKCAESLAEMADEAYAGGNVHESLVYKDFADLLSKLSKLAQSKA
jgi:hypothetical protein